MIRDLIFVSSPQRELAKIRRDLCYAILTDPYFKEYFDVFLFENLPASHRDPEGNYLEKVDSATVYLGIFGRTYGTPGADGLSPTEKEYNRASLLGKDRLIFVKRMRKGVPREPEMEALVQRASREVTYSEFGSSAELQRDVMRALLLWQQERRRS